MGTDEVALAKLSSELYIRGDDVSEKHAVDWSAEHAHLPDVVLLPRSTADVSSILKVCHAAGQSVVVQGGMTGLSGGATPQPGEWAMSLERMNKIIELDPAAATLTVAAGTPLESMQNAAVDAGFRLPLDLGSRGSCMAGGLVSTNAGGNQVIRFGMARALVLGLEAVLADGTVIPAQNKLLKNNSGFDLKQLFIGSEGALGIITEVTFRLFPQKASRQTALCGIPTFDSVISLLQQMGHNLDSITSFEVMWSDYYHESLRAIKAKDPVGGEHPFYVLLETEGVDHEATQKIFQSALMSSMESGLVADVVIAQSQAEEKAFWAIRDGIAELLPEYKPSINMDVGIPITSMDDFTREVRQQLRTMHPDCRMLVFGHVGDGNIHIIATTGREEDKHGMYDMIYQKTRDVGGAITAEHGVGVQKKEWLHFTRSEAELDLMRSIKGLLDPKGIINNGRVI